MLSCAPLTTGTQQSGVVKRIAFDVHLHVHASYCNTLSVLTVASHVNAQDYSRGR